MKAFVDLRMTFCVRIKSSFRKLHMRLSTISICGIAIVTLGALSGCGTYTPDIMEPWGQEGDEQTIVNAIVRRVRCEIRNAVNDLLEDDIRDAKTNPGPRKLEWLESWGVQATLTLTIDEKTNLNPGVAFNSPMIGAKTWFPAGINIPASQSYALGLGGKFGSTATRIDKINWFYPISELRKNQPDDKSCDSPDMPNSYIIVESNLKIADWLYAAVSPNQTEVVKFPDKRGGDPYNKDVISHQVKFVIDTSGDITPTWRLVRITANSAGPFFGASRSRTQDLTITFGPTMAPPTPAPTPTPTHVARKKVEPAKVAVMPDWAAQNAHLASQIGLSVANNLSNLQQ